MTQENREVEDMTEKDRISVTLTVPYLEALIKLVDVGVYINQGEVIRAALRMLFASYAMEPFINEKTST